MMTVNFIAMGRLKEPYFREACAEYQKRLGAFARVTVSEPDPIALPHEPSPAQIDKALAREAELIRAQAAGFKIAMCVEGKALSSEELAAKLENIGNGGISTVSFIIGSSFGLDEGLKRECDMRLSMSPMTFPHSLARVMLFEQVYRAFSIMNNSKYHK
ncbi:MAG: 23S rRNA (pseudouridine(1915)-N(3))-methyltransferase RlmH [Lachnospiraceae bacterium]|nr:23S rRNA (pseudouridine(1915)-N(3))-methyltransferase RlmH [Ruminococcus sp.]MCM1274744.1 23S rRNA (pseudouridine(1915)-N(3))-methyltransferase RlmH [Lachnospiraceae bacterium]